MIKYFIYPKKVGFSEWLFQILKALSTTTFFRRKHWCENLSWRNVTSLPSTEDAAGSLTFPREPEIILMCVSYSARCQHNDFLNSHRSINRMLSSPLIIPRGLQCWDLGTDCNPFTGSTFTDTLLLSLPWQSNRLLLHSCRGGVGKCGIITMEIK